MLIELEREAAEGMGSRVELFEQIRRDRDREGLSIRALAERHGVHRRAVRQALACPVPPAKRLPVRRPAPKLGPYRALIDAWLEADRQAPRKQRHTAKRIWARLIDEHGADVAETTVRDYVRARRRAMGWPVGEVFVPQVHAPGVGAEVDWGEAHVDLAGVRTRVFLFFMRASFSGAAFCQASLVCTQQAFLECHAQAFDWFGGVFEEVRFDNLTSAVKSVLKDFKSYRVVNAKTAERARTEGKRVEHRKVERWIARPLGSIAIEVATKQDAVQLADTLPGTWAHLRRGVYRVLPLDAQRAKTVTSAEAHALKQRGWDVERRTRSLWMVISPAAAQTRNQYRDILGACFNYAVRQRWITHNPLAQVRRISKRADRERVLRREDFYNPQEVQPLLAHAATEFEEAFWLCGAHAGLRPPW